MLEPPYDWIVPVAAAPFVGSFLHLLAVRLPAGEDVVAARSRCRSCGKTLAVRELVPIFSWLVQRGRCSACGAGIGWTYPVVEVLALVVAAWAALMMHGAVLWVTIALGWTLLALAVMDLRSMMLSDVLTLPLIAVGLAVVAWLDVENVPNHMIAAVVGGLLIVAVAWAYRRARGREGIGMGDAKLMAAAGAWVGLEGIGTVLLYGVAATVILVLVKSAAGERMAPETAVPLGAGLAMGLWLVWLYGPLMVVA